MKSLRDISWQEEGVIVQALRAYRFSLKSEIKKDPTAEKAYADRLALIKGLLEDGK